MHCINTTTTQTDFKIGDLILVFSTSNIREILKKKQKMFVHDFELTNFCSQMPIVSNQECIRVLNMFVRDLFKMK